MKKMRKRVSIQKKALRDRYALEIETDERGTFYLISKTGKRKLELLRRRGGGVIVMIPKKAIFCKQVRLEVEPNGTLHVQTYAPELTLKIY